MESGGAVGLGLLVLPALFFDYLESGGAVGLGLLYLLSKTCVAVPGIAQPLVQVQHRLNCPTVRALLERTLDFGRRVDRQWRTARDEKHVVMGEHCWLALI